MENNQQDIEVAEKKTTWIERLKLLCPIDVRPDRTAVQVKIVSPSDSPSPRRLAIELRHVDSGHVTDSFLSLRPEEVHWLEYKFYRISEHGGVIEEYCELEPERHLSIRSDVTKYGWKIWRITQSLFGRKAKTYIVSESHREAFYTILKHLSIFIDLHKDTSSDRLKFADSLATFYTHAPTMKLTPDFNIDVRNYCFFLGKAEMEEIPLEVAQEGKFNESLSSTIEFIYSHHF